MTRHLMRGLLVKNWGSKIYIVHHTTRKTMGAKQLAKAIGFAKQLRYPSRSTIFKEGAR
jgi:hypothetical protein